MKSANKALLGVGAISIIAGLLPPYETALDLTINAILIVCGAFWIVIAMRKTGD